MRRVAEASEDPEPPDLLRNGNGFSALILLSTRGSLLVNLMGVGTWICTREGEGLWI